MNTKVSICFATQRTTRIGCACRVQIGTLLLLRTSNAAARRWFPTQSRVAGIHERPPLDFARAGFVLFAGAADFAVRAPVPAGATVTTGCRLTEARSIANVTVPKRSRPIAMSAS
jgi:hypothetical protein